MRIKESARQIHKFVVRQEKRTKSGDKGKHMSLSCVRDKTHDKVF
jgi:hypothetical protein